MDMFIRMELGRLVDRGEDLDGQRCLRLVQDRKRVPAPLLSRMSHPSLLSSRPRHKRKRIAAEQEEWLGAWCGKDLREAWLFGGS